MASPVLQSVSRIKINEVGQLKLNVRPEQCLEFDMPVVHGRMVLDY